jgi:hypothetical protein
MDQRRIGTASHPKRSSARRPETWRGSIVRCFFPQSMLSIRMCAYALNLSTCVAASALASIPFPSYIHPSIPPLHTHTHTKPPIKPTGFRLLPGPCLLAWRRLPAQPPQPPPRSYFSPPPSPPTTNDPTTAATADGAGLGVWCWSAGRGQWTWHALGLKQGKWEEDGAVAVRVEWGGTLPLPLAEAEGGEEDGVAALFDVEFRNERHAWRAVRVPPSPSLPLPAEADCNAGVDAGDGQRQAQTPPFLPLPFPPARALKGCACLCPSALDGGRTTIYTVCARTGLPSAWRKGEGDTPAASTVLKKGEYASSLLWAPTAVCAFLPRPASSTALPSEEGEGGEWLAVHHGRDVMGRLYLFRRCAPIWAVLFVLSCAVCFVCLFVWLFGCLFVWAYPPSGTPYPRPILTRTYTQKGSASASCPTGRSCAWVASCGGTAWAWGVGTNWRSSPTARIWRGPGRTRGG